MVEVVLGHRPVGREAPADGVDAPRGGGGPVPRHQVGVAPDLERGGLVDAEAAPEDRLLEEARHLPEAVLLRVRVVGGAVLAVVATQAHQVAVDVGVVEGLPEGLAAALFHLLRTDVGAGHGAVHPRVEVHPPRGREVVGEQRRAHDVGHVEGRLVRGAGGGGGGEPAGQGAVVRREQRRGEAGGVGAVAGAGHVEEVGELVLPAGDVRGGGGHGPDDDVPAFVTGDIGPELGLVGAVGTAAPQERHGALHPGGVPGVAHLGTGVDAVHGRLAAGDEQGEDHPFLPSTISLSQARPSFSTLCSRRSPMAKDSWVKG